MKVLQRLLLVVCGFGMVISDSFVTILKKLQFETCEAGLSSCSASNGIGTDYHEVIFYFDYFFLCVCV